MSRHPLQRERPLYTGRPASQFEMDRNQSDPRNSTSLQEDGRQQRRQYDHDQARQRLSPDEYGRWARMENQTEIELWNQIKNGKANGYLYQKPIECRGQEPVHQQAFPVQSNDPHDRMPGLMFVVDTQPGYAPDQDYNQMIFFPSQDDALIDSPPGSLNNSTGCWPSTTITQPVYQSSPTNNSVAHTWPNRLEFGWPTISRPLRSLTSTTAANSASVALTSGSSSSSNSSGGILTPPSSASSSSSNSSGGILTPPSSSSASSSSSNSSGRILTSPSPASSQSPGTENGVPGSASPRSSASYGRLNPEPPLPAYGNRGFPAPNLASLWESVWDKPVRESWDTPISEKGRRQIWPRRDPLPNVRRVLALQDPFHQPLRGASRITEGLAEEIEEDLQSWTPNVRAFGQPKRSRFEGLWTRLSKKDKSNEQHSDQIEHEARMERHVEMILEEDTQEAPSSPEGGVRLVPVMLGDGFHG